MIATILPGSSDFHAIRYNEHKVSTGAARLIEAINVRPPEAPGGRNAEELVKFFRIYSARNGRIRKAQLHVAFSCKGREMSEEELLAFAREWLREMGYLEPGQPILVYSHHDTGNNHLHIVTSRIAPDGHKIDHCHERRRSQQVIDKILGNDRKAKTAEDIQAARSYAFSSLPQFKAVLQSMGYEVYEKEGAAHVKRGGVVQGKLPLAEITALFKSRKRDGKDIRRQRQLRAILRKYRDTCSDKEELNKELKTKFGLDLVFYGRRDKPYGYLIVDHANKAVIPGARVLALDELLDFATPEQRIERMEGFLIQLLSANSKITTHEVNDRLRRHRAYISKGVLYMAGQQRPMHPSLAAAIDRNNRVERIEQFYPATVAERLALCDIFKVKQTEFVSLSRERPESHTMAVIRLRELFNDHKVKDLRAALREDGFVVLQKDSGVFAIDFERHIVIDLEKEGFNIKRLKLKRPKRRTLLKALAKQALKDRTSPFHDAGGGSAEGNREWEVGQAGYGEVDEARTLRR